jgi:hypothetical protein
MISRNETFSSQVSSDRSRSRNGNVKITAAFEGAEEPRELFEGLGDAS